MIGRDHTRCAGHVLDDDVGIARNVFAHVRGQHAGIEIVGVPGREPDDNPDGLAFIKRRLSVKIRKTNKDK